MSLAHFSHITDIDLKDRSSWSGKIFLTFDIDWAPDEVIDYTHKLISSHKIKSTWFVTHSSPAVDKLVNDPLIEIGLHPNFNELFKCNSNYTSNEIIYRLKNLFPMAKSVRSHSLTQSERLLDEFSKNGLHWICNSFIPKSSDLLVAPFELWDNLIIVPHQFQDNVYLKMNSTAPLFDNDQSLSVLNFHPIHIFLNTDTLDRYDRVKNQINSSSFNLSSYRNVAFGVKTMLDLLIDSLLFANDT